ncbi:nicotinate-nucleotide adenylyltransferase [Halomonas sp. 328]|uniref:nicotinate-nucleotide adenylyltransferase n=1 Tax=Halomonas sp. 328 TaxID=2776704 RepID=UPI0018A72302|nr:nicotinate-nucleotide adenylyltransferase [Halomonas sp. 328]MBF8221284.1 nicotinate-nucleotide adenylyltransferase [Halomonas sp. 328]
MAISVAEGDPTAAPAVAMLGGTFDPVHLGHLRSAVELREVLGLDRVQMIPAHLPPHRAAPGVSSRERLAMLRLGIGDTPGLVADDRELRRDGPSYSVDTLASLRAELGERARLIMAVGHDAFLKLAEWRDPEGLFAQAHVVVIERPDHDAPLPPPLRALLAGREVTSVAALMAASRGRLLRLSLPTRLAISATGIRRRLAEGRSVRYLLPEPVRRHIESRGLYRGDGAAPDGETR